MHIPPTWQSTPAHSAPNAGLHEVFARIATLYPGRIVIRSSDAAPTSTESDERANGFADALQRRGVEPALWWLFCCPDPPSPFLERDARDPHHELGSSQPRSATGAPSEQRGHFPDETTAIMCLYLVTRSVDPTRRARRTTRRKPTRNTHPITFAGRLETTTHS